MINNSCITGLSPTGHCGSAAYCPENHKCCSSCKLDCNIRCGHLDAANNKEETK